MQEAKATILLRQRTKAYLLSIVGSSESEDDQSIYGGECTGSYCVSCASQNTKIKYFMTITIQFDYPGQGALNAKIMKLILHQLYISSLILFSNSIYSISNSKHNDTSFEKVARKCVYYFIDVAPLRGRLLSQAASVFGKLLRSLPRQSSVGAASRGALERAPTRRLPGYQ